MKKNLITFKGEVFKILPNSMYIIFFPILNKKVVCYLCGKLRIKFLKLVISDRVSVEFDKSNLSKGRIVGCFNESKGIN